MRRRALRLILPALFLLEGLLLWSGVLEFRDAVLIVAGVEALLVLFGAGEVFLVVRGYRKGRRNGLDSWAALEDGLSALLPGKVAWLVALEPRLFVCLLRWVSGRARPKPGEFRYHRRSWFGPMLLLVALVSPVELVLLHLLVHLFLARMWLQVALLAFELYGTFWIFGFYASLVCNPHRLEKDGIRLRYGAHVEGFVPYARIEKVERESRKSPNGRDGLAFSSEEDALYLSVGGKTDLTLLLCSPQKVQGLFSTAGPAKRIRICAEDPKRLAKEIQARTGASTSKVNAGSPQSEPSGRLPVPEREGRRA